jgi:hypothetical protein
LFHLPSLEEEAAAQEAASQAAGKVA